VIVVERLPVELFTLTLGLTVNPGRNGGSGKSFRAPELVLDD